MTNTIDRIAFEDALANGGVLSESFRSDYSGRGMFGATCIGVVVPPSDVSRVGTALRQAAELLREDIEADEDDLDWDTEEQLAADLERMVDSLSYDNMGLDMVVYFPGWEFSD